MQAIDSQNEPKKGHGNGIKGLFGLCSKLPYQMLVMTKLWARPNIVETCVWIVSLLQTEICQYVSMTCRAPRVAFLCQNRVKLDLIL